MHPAMPKLDVSCICLRAENQRSPTLTVLAMARLPEAFQRRPEQRLSRRLLGLDCCAEAITLRVLIISPSDSLRCCRSVEAVRQFGRSFKLAVGRADSLTSAALRTGRRWFQGQRAAGIAFR